MLKVNTDAISVIKSIPLGVILIGLGSLLINSSTIVIVSLSPIYLTSVLGVSTLGLGFWEGLIELVSWASRIVAGVLCDFCRKRKTLLVPAFFFVAVSRPIWAFTANIQAIFFARFLDRLGNGLGAIPREALVSDMAPQGTAGQCYGLRQSLGQAGSFIGAFVILIVTGKTISNYPELFGWASVPAVLAFLLVAFLVKEKENGDREGSPKKVQKEKKEDQSLVQVVENAKLLPGRYWQLIAISCLFMLSNHSTAFHGVWASKQINHIGMMPAIMVLQNIASVLSAFPIGYLSQRWGRKQFLACGFFFTIVSNGIYSFSSGLGLICLATIFWGLQVGFTQSLWIAEISEMTCRKMKGIAFGIYYISTGISLLLANVFMGYLIEEIGYRFAFGASAAVALFALVALPFFRFSSGYQNT